MIQFIPVYEKNVIAIRVSGKLTHEEYQAFIPQIETQIKRYGKISLLMELDNFTGWELAAAKDDLEFGLKHRNDIEKFALVGNKAWQHWISILAKPFINGKVKYFPREDMHKAWDWVRNKKESDVSIDSSENTTTEHVVKDITLQPYKNILVAIDFSPHSMQAAKRASELAKYYGAKLTLLHMVEELSVYDAYYDPIDMDMMLKSLPTYNAKSIEEHNIEARALGKKRLQRLAKNIGIDNAGTEILSGNTASGIVSYSEAQQTDLIVMGTHGRHGFARILGSVAHSVQSNARCETLIVPLK